MGNNDLDLDRIRELQAQARGEKPIEATSGTGFHPDQLTSYPLARIGPSLYFTQIEAVVPSYDNQDYIVVDAEEMDDYVPNPKPEDFDDSIVTYQIRGLEHGGTITGGAVLAYDDPDPEFDRMAEDNPELREREEYPNVVLATSNKKEEFEERGLNNVRNMLANEEAVIRVLGS